MFSYVLGSLKTPFVKFLVLLATEYFAEIISLKALEDLHTYATARCDKRSQLMGNGFNLCNT